MKCSVLWEYTAKLFTDLTRFSNTSSNFHGLLLMHQSIPAESSPAPPPPRATVAHLPAFSIPGVGHLKILRCPGAGHFPTPGLFPSFWHARGFLSEYNYTEDITGKKADWLICQGQGVVKACSRFYACISSLLIKPELHSETRELSTWINVFWLVNQISVDIIWRTSFHIYNLFIT